MKVYKTMPKLMMAVILLSALSHIDEPRVAALDKSSFTDLPESHWSFKAVQEMYGKKIVEGYPDGTFRPNQTLTRAEFAALLYKTAQLNEKKADSATVFKDVDSSAWYKPYADALKGTFVQNSLKSETEVFNPDAPALREDVAAAIVRLRGWAGGKPADLQSKFNDFNSISEGAAQDLAAAVERGIISGYEDGTIRGKAALTRVEAAVVLTKAFSEEISSSTEQEQAKKSEAAAQIPEVPIKTQALNPKPIYAIVDLLGEDVGVTYKGNLYDSGRSVLDKLPITNLTVDSQGNIYFVQTTKGFSVSFSTIERLNVDAHLASTVETVDDSMIASLSGPLFDKMREQKLITKHDLTPIKILASVNSSEKQFIVNWINGKFWSLFSFSDKKIALVNTIKGTTMTTQDFIIQHPNGDYLFSDITNGNVQRIKPGDGENEQIAAVGFSGKPLTALVQGELLYILDPGSKTIIKVDLQLRKVVEKIAVQADNIVFAAVKDNQFYISTGKNLLSVDLAGRIEPFLEEKQLVYNDLSSSNISFSNTRNQPGIMEISEFAFEPSGNIVFLDNQSSNIRRLRFVKEQTIEPKPLTVAQTANRLAKPKADFINQDIGYQKDEQGNMVISMVNNEQGNLYVLEKKRPLNRLRLWSQDSFTWESMDYFFGLKFDYYDAQQKRLDPMMYTFTGGLYFDERNKMIYRTAWSQDLNIASINAIAPEAITVGYMVDKGPITEKDFIAFNGTGQMVVSDVSQGELWFIDRDRKGYKLLPSEVGLEIRYSGKSTAAIWDEQKLSVLDTGNKTLTQVKINDHQYAAQIADLKIEGTIDAVSTHEDKFYVMSGTVLYCIETNGSISWTEDLAGYLRERKLIHKMSMDLNGRLMLLDERGNLQRVQLYEAKK
ncbi:S-layer homology domain-containing protein [Paenibacillus radicis (ex Xue et al. 2023)]|uniref:S-layer homology domain-containing protein n=1 Tax=Paenibacillus radicis (ex Xue et al. 2023) TaxID=2972489 RepID=A0ABT1YLT1_9BACL|nr:S-layer homology domain-containing protein [Paenibacillus radicis (ex Xue et al. 2023)]MCR8634150.1 S-layer homology domain-containing protein [Paenibacillus radicis (ex Xue et al. 2023)]